MASGLGRFEILDPIGAGGMGSVYRAYDPKLDRQLAIKVVGGEARLEPGSTLNLAAISPELQQRTRVLAHRISTDDDEAGDQRLLEEARAQCLDVELTSLESTVDYLATLEKTDLERAVSVANGDGRPQACLLIEDESRHVQTDEAAAILRALMDLRTAADGEYTKKRDELDALLARSKDVGDKRLFAETLETLAREANRAARCRSVSMPSQPSTT